jgi:hypothetical protein
MISPQVERAYRRSNSRARTDGRRPVAPQSGSQARAILHRLLKSADFADRETAGRTVMSLAVEDWLFTRRAVAERRPIW